ncbi:MAG TPA: hypothetical protein VM261_01490 [Kofleriaceae bacterium]|nr:hypothetical protein [Kofleriaceae bacterium]
MRRLLATIGVAAGLSAGAAGCQSFIGVEDAQQHLPRLNGNYVVAIARERPSDPTTVDIIRMQGTATLDVDNRSLSLAMSILGFNGTNVLTETSLAGIDFADDSDELDYLINISVPAGALNPSPAPMPADLTINVNVRFIAEADYAFCAKPLGPGDMVPSLGSILVEDFNPLPASTDDDCDDPLRD